MTMNLGFRKHGIQRQFALSIFLFIDSLVVFKSPTTKIDFVDFLQIQAAFWKTNYTTFSYLPISMYEQDMSEI